MVLIIKHRKTFDRRKYRNRIDAMVDDLNNLFNYLWLMSKITSDSLQHLLGICLFS